MIIGFAGLAKSGKDTLAGMVTERAMMVGLECSCRPFAKPIKDLAAVFGFTHEQLYNQDLKHVEDAFWGITPRMFLQLVGTDMFRDKFRQDVWIKLFEHDVTRNADIDLWLVPDVRFENEVEAVHGLGGIVVKVVRGSAGLDGSEASHTSERGIPDELVDVTVDNNGTLDELGYMADIVLNMARKGCRRQ